MEKKVFMKSDKDLRDMYMYTTKAWELQFSSLGEIVIKSKITIWIAIDIDVDLCLVLILYEIEICCSENLISRKIWYRNKFFTRGITIESPVYNFFCI